MTWQIREKSETSARADRQNASVVWTLSDLFSSRWEFGKTSYTCFHFVSRANQQISLAACKSESRPGLFPNCQRISGVPTWARTHGRRPPPAAELSTVFVSIVCLFINLKMKIGAEFFFIQKIRFQNENQSALVMACLTLALSLLFLTSTNAQVTEKISFGRIMTKEDISTSSRPVKLTEVSQHSQTQSFSGNLLEESTEQTQSWNRGEEVWMAKTADKIPQPP